MGRRNRIASTAMIALLPGAMLSAPARAGEVLGHQRVVVTGWSEGAITGQTAQALGLTLSSAPAGTTISGAMMSCGRPIEQAYLGHTLTVDSDGKASAFWLLPVDNQNLPTEYPADDSDTDHLSPRLEVGDLVGPTYQYSLTVTEPGSDPYVVSGSEPLHSVHRPSCAEIDSTVRRTIKVTRWSTFKGQFRVGRTVTVTRPQTVGPSKVSYEWHVATRTIASRHRSLHLTRAMRHKLVYVDVRIRQAGHSTQEQGLSTGRAVK